jgi:stage V sporulation protein AE
LSKTKDGVITVVFLKAFLVGGLICVVAQLLMDLTSYKITPAHILVGFVVGGAILSALGAYGPLVDWAGAGATVPLTGFGHLLAQGTIEAVKEKGFLGVFSGGVTATAAGITAAVVFGYLVSLAFRPKG